MAITNQTRPEDLIVAWRRQPDGSLATFASLSLMVEQVDDSTSPPTITPIRPEPAADIGISEVAAVVGEQLPALVAQVAALQAQLDQALDDKAAAVAALSEGQAQFQDELAAMTAARDALQAQLDQLAAQQPQQLG